MSALLGPANYRDYSGEGIIWRSLFKEQLDVQSGAELCYVGVRWTVHALLLLSRDSHRCTVAETRSSCFIEDIVSALLSCGWADAT